MINPKLDTLLAVAELRSCTKASRQLSLTQPAVSHQIEQLEQECRAALFFRGKSEFKLTPEGEIAVQYARRLKALHEKMLQEILNEQNKISKLNIGLTHSLENHTMMECLAQYAQQNPRTRISIITKPINILYEMIENYELDIAMVEGRRLGGRLNFLMLDTDCLMCAMSSSHELAKQSMMTLSSLKKQNLILRTPGSDARQLFEASLIGLNEHIDNFHITLEAENVSTIKELVGKNLGVSILPQSVCAQDVQRKKLVMLPIENLSMTRELNLVYNREFAHRELLSQLAAIYQNAAHNASGKAPAQKAESRQAAEN